MNVGNVEKYRTGDGWRYRVRWSLPNGSRRSRSFRLRRDADAWLRQVEADRMRGVVNDPRRSSETLAEYAPRWIADRTKLAPKTVELYESQLRVWLIPGFGSSALGAITVEQVRRWCADIARKRSETTAAKCYRLLHAIMHTAETDGLIPRNPCRVEGAAVERAPERPLLTVVQVVELAEAITPRYRALVLLAAFGGLRRGELLGLRRRHVDEVHGTVRVEGQAQRLKGRGRVVRQTKSDAGMRTVALNSAVIAELVSHMHERTAPEPEAWLFVESNGSPVREADLYAAWWAACRLCGLVAPIVGVSDGSAREEATEAGDVSEEAAKVRPAVRFHDYADLMIMPTRGVLVQVRGTVAEVSVGIIHRCRQAEAARGSAMVEEARSQKPNVCKGLTRSRVPVVCIFPVSASLRPLGIMPTAATSNSRCNGFSSPRSA